MEKNKTSLTKRFYQSGRMDLFAPAMKELWWIERYSESKSLKGALEGERVLADLIARLECHNTRLHPYRPWPDGFRAEVKVIWRGKVPELKALVARHDLELEEEG